MTTGLSFKEPNRVPMATVIKIKMSSAVENPFGLFTFFEETTSLSALIFL